MTSKNDELHRQFDAALQRLGLRPKDLPGGNLAFGPGSLEHLVGRLKTLRPGATWRDAIPEIPAHWEAGKPDTWTHAYRPLGSFDYQELPTAPAVHVTWSDGAADRLPEIVASARAAGWHIFGAGLIPTVKTVPIEYHAMIVMERGTTDEELNGFSVWVRAQGRLTLAAIPRLGTEHYL